MPCSLVVFVTALKTHYICIYSTILLIICILKFIFLNIKLYLCSYVWIYKSGKQKYCAFNIWSHVTSVSLKC